MVRNKIKDYRKGSRWITNGEVNKVYTSGEIESGYSFGRTLNHQWVYKDEECLFINSKDFEKYIEMGWKSGRKMKKTKCWITNGLKSLMIDVEHLDFYLDDGWFKGRLP